MNVYFMEVTIKHKSKYSFRIERLISFQDMGTWTRIYLDNDSFDIDENYYDFVSRLNKWQ